MRCALRKACVAGVAVVVSSTALADPIPESRRVALDHLLRHDCGSCHGLTMKGGLGPPLLPSSLEERLEEDLVAIILDGVPGTPMPPWRSELAPDEAAWLVRRLKEGGAP